MKMDRLGVALIIAAILGAAVYVHGLEKISHTAVVFLLGVWVYVNATRSFK